MHVHSPAWPPESASGGYLGTANELYSTPPHSQIAAVAPVSHVATLRNTTCIFTQAHAIPYDATVITQHHAVEQAVPPLLFVHAVLHHFESFCFVTLHVISRRFVVSCRFMPSFRIPFRVIQCCLATCL